MPGEHEPLTAGEIHDAWSFVRLAMDEPSDDTVILLARLATTARIGAEAGVRIAELTARAERAERERGDAWSDAAGLRADLVGGAPEAAEARLTALEAENARLRERLNDAHDVAKTISERADDLVADLATKDAAS